MRRHWRCRTAVLSLLLVRAAVAETGSASECLHGRDPRALSAAGVAAFLRCFAQRAGANLAAPVLASGLLGEELSALSAGEMQDALQLSPAHAELLRNVLDGHGGSPQSAAEQARGRFQNFMDAVCRRCAYSRLACGCELGEENPAFEVLRNYAAEYDTWRTTIQHDASGPAPAWSDSVWADIDAEQPKWIVIDVTMGLGNNLLAYVNGMLLALCLVGRALAINTHEPYPLHPVLDFVREEQIPPWRGVYA